MSDTKIEWCDKSWNPITGCTPVGAGCDNCYAKEIARRFGHGCYKGFTGVPFSRPCFHPYRLERPLRWKQKKEWVCGSPRCDGVNHLDVCGIATRPLRIFVNSMGDLFHEDVLPLWINDVWMQMFNCTKHTFIILTKRPDRLLRWTKAAAGAKAWPENEIWPPHIHLYVSVWDQESADEFIPILLDTPAAVRGVSIEPMLGPVDLGLLMNTDTVECENCGQWWTPIKDNPTCPCSESPTFKPAPSLNHVILGGETGPGARCIPTLDCVLSVRDQCQAAGVPFFFKGWGTAILPKTDPDYMMIDGRTWEELP